MHVQRELFVTLRENQQYRTKWIEQRRRLHSLHYVFVQVNNYPKTRP